MSGSGGFGIRGFLLWWSWGGGGFLVGGVGGLGWFSLLSERKEK